MNQHSTRRQFLQAAAAGGALAFLAHLPPVSAADAQLDPKLVRLDAGIEPLVQLLEETPRDRLLEEVADRVRKGTSYRDVLAALLLAGVRNVEPRPQVGFKFHAVLVVNSAHLASLSSPDTDRWLPIFWALDYFKAAQAQNIRERGGWRMGPVNESAIPAARKAKDAFVAAMNDWDAPAADAAIAGLVRTAGADEVFEQFWRLAPRDFRSIGHKIIFASNSRRTLNCVGWQHAEPVLRSLAYACLADEGNKEPAKNDYPADRAGRRNRDLAKQIRAEWQDGKPDTQATAELLAVMRKGSEEDVCKEVVQRLNKGLSPQSVWDALLCGGAELLMRKPGIVALHALTSSNALHFAYETSGDDETRRWLLLQNAAFVVQFRDLLGKAPELAIDQLEAVPTRAQGAEAVEEIFADVSKDRLAAARKVLGYVKDQPRPKAFIDAARRLVFLKGTDSHDYKFSSAVLEDYAHLSPGWRERFLAASVFNLKGTGDRDNSLVQRTRAALKG
jgi:hypothetical protein